jgi:hypothetical protein
LSRQGKGWLCDLVLGSAALQRCEMDQIKMHAAAAAEVWVERRLSATKWIGQSARGFSR